VLHSVGEYEAGLIESYREARSRLWGSQESERVLVRPEPPPRALVKPAPITVKVAKVKKWPKYLPPVVYDHCEGNDVALPVHIARSWREIANEVCVAYGVMLEDIKGFSRSTIPKLARHELFSRLREERKLSYAAIGDLLGGFDHTTVRHGCIQHKQRRLSTLSTVVTESSAPVPATDRKQPLTLGI
jgi:hypothetical protein